MPQPNPDQIRRLQEARDLILSVYTELDGEKFTCSQCNAATYGDKDSWHQRQMLGAAIGRLEKVVHWGVKGGVQSSDAFGKYEEGS